MMSEDTIAVGRIDLTAMTALGTDGAIQYSPEDWPQGTLAIETVTPRWRTSGYGFDSVVETFWFRRTSGPCEVLVLDTERLDASVPDERRKRQWVLMTREAADGGGSDGPMTLELGGAAFAVAYRRPTPREREVQLRWSFDPITAMWLR